MKKSVIFWFRRDLRLDDNRGLFEALSASDSVLPIFIFDSNILNKLANKKDARVTFIYNELKRLDTELKPFGSSLLVKYGNPLDIFRDLVNEYDLSAVYTNHDYEPKAINRDNAVADFLSDKGILFKTYKDQVIFEKDEIMTKEKTPYTIYTPYMKKWRMTFSNFSIKNYETSNLINNFFKTKFKLPSIESIGFNFTDLNIPKALVNIDKIKKYSDRRDFPGIDGTTKLGVYLRFGTISIRKLVDFAAKNSDVFLNELIWREFYMMLLWHFPYVEEGAFKKKFNNINWLNNESDFQKWCAGKTGFPLVDAGMRELNQTGFMHNRARMITASFLTKNLLIDWRWGEKYFAERLLDFELASNNGGWQWAAGTGADAAPYFRIFNPDTQLKKFDSDLRYIKKWLPEYGVLDYPKRMIDLKETRVRCLEIYKNV